MKNILILVLLAFGSVIAPILEELSFRGFFTENRKLKLIALIGFLSYTTMSFCSKYSIVVAVVNGLVFLLAIALFRQFKSNALGTAKMFDIQEIVPMYEQVYKQAIDSKND